RAAEHSRFRQRGAAAPARDARAVRPVDRKRLCRCGARGRAARPGRRADRSHRGAARARAAHGHARALRRARRAPVRHAVAGVPRRHHAGGDVHVGARVELPDLSGNRRDRRPSQPVASRGPRRAAGQVREGEHLPGAVVREIPRQAARHTRGGRDAVRSRDVSVWGGAQQPEPPCPRGSPARRVRRVGQRRTAPRRAAEHADDEPAGGDAPQVGHLHRDAGRQHRRPGLRSMRQVRRSIRASLALWAAWAALGLSASEGRASTPLPLVHAIEAGDHAAVRALLKRRVDVNAAEPDGTTALPAGETALMTAARTGSVPVIRALLAHGADVNAREGWKGQTALMWAAAENNAAAVKVLVEAGADVNARSRSGAFSAFLFAVRAGHIEAARALIEAGADVDEKLPDGTSALVLAIMNAHYEAAAFLLDWGAD